MSKLMAPAIHIFPTGCEITACFSSIYGSLRLFPKAMTLLMQKTQFFKLSFHSFLFWFSFLFTERISLVCSTLDFYVNIALLFRFPVLTAMQPSLQPDTHIRFSDGRLLLSLRRTHTIKWPFSLTQSSLCPPLAQVLLSLHRIVDTDTSPEVQSGPSKPRTFEEPSALVYPVYWLMKPLFTLLLQMFQLIAIENVFSFWFLSLNGNLRENCESDLPILFFSSVTLPPEQSCSQMNPTFRHWT